ncbi:MAG: helix-turn-helix domain-containing protein [Cyclobacteriaceae bacterium]
MNLDLWSIVMIVFVFHGFFLLSTIAFTDSRRKKKENHYLSFLILVLIWYLSEFFMIRNTINIGVDLFYGTRYGSWFLFGPLTLFYFKSITNSNWSHRRIDLLHFAPFVLFAIAIPAIYGDVLHHRQVDYGMLSVFDHREKIISPMQYLYSMVFIGQFLHLAYYLFRNLGLVKTYRVKLSDEYSNINGNVKWLKVFNMSFLVVLLVTAIFLYILLVTDIYRRHLDYLYVLPVGALFYLISYYLINTEWKTTENSQSLKYAKSSLDTQNISQYIEKLNNLLGDQKVFLDKELRLTDLAEKMELKGHHLSQLINQEYNVTFFDLINQHRVFEAKQIIKRNPEYTLLQVAFDAGFNNKTSFVNAFKKFEKSTPSQFRGTLIYA